MRNFVDKLKRYFSFSRSEFISLIIAAFALAFVTSFNWWGETSFDPRAGLINFLGAFFMVFLSLLVHHGAQRALGIHWGFRVEQKLWWYGLMGSLVLVLITNGRIQFLGVTATYVTLLPRHRLGRFRYGINLREVSKVCAVGPLSNVLLGGFVKTLSLVNLFPKGLADQFFLFSLVFAAWNLIPLPPLDGGRIMYYSRLTYAFLFGTIGGYALMVYLFGVYSYVLALLIGGVSWLLTWSVVERGLGG